MRLARLLGVSLLPGTVAAQVPARDTAVRLPPITVTVTRAAEPVNRAPFAISVRTAADLAPADPGLSLSAALAGVPGVASQNRYSLARDESLVIRGFGARSAFGIRGVRVLLDGIPQTLPDGQGQLTNVDLRRVRRAEVLRGTTSGLHGNAAGGVVSLSTDYTRPARVAPDARVLAGSQDLVVLDAGVAAPFGSGTVLLDASRQAGNGHREQDRFEIWRAGARAAVPLGGTTRVIAVAHAARMPEAQDPGALNAAELAADPAGANPANVAINAGKSVTQAQAGVTVEHASGAARVSVTGFGVGRDLDQRLPFATIELRRWAWGARAETSVPLGGALGALLVGGMDAQWQHDDRINRAPGASTVTRDQGETVRELGPFVQLRMQPVPRVSLIAGGRYDAVSFRVEDDFLSDGDDSGARTMTALSGTLGAAVQVAPGLLFYGNVGTGFETPTTTELGNQPDGTAGFNPDLEPQRAVQVEAGARASHGPLSLAVAAFHARVRDALIPFEVPTDPGRRYFRNAGRTRHRGLEVEAAATVPWGLRAGVAYTLSDLRFVDFATDAGRYDGNRIPGVPLHLARLALGVTRGPVSLDVETRTASATWADDANTAPADGWWVADLVARVDVRVGGFTLRPTAGVENLFDETYVAAVAVNGAAGRYYEPAPGRTVYVALSVLGH
jgi:iron complex outermembrane receptor protein